MPDYTDGEATYRSPHARFETKPSTVYADTYRGVRRDTGGGYERVRSWEHDPTAPGDRKTDVYAYIHRLCAVAWLLPPDAPLAALDGYDVHHESGVEWDNREENLTLMDHGRHSEVTQAQMRAWAEDAKREVERREQGVDPDPNRCGRCGATAGTFARSADWDGLRCIDCSMVENDGATIEIV